MQRRVDGQGALLGGSLEILADDGLDRAVPVYPPDPQVVPVEDEGAAAAVELDVEGVVEGGFPRLSAVAVELAQPGAGDGADHPRLVAHCRGSPRGGGAAASAAAAGQQGGEGKGDGEAGVQPAGKAASGRPGPRRKRPASTGGGREPFPGRRDSRCSRYSSVHMKSLPAHSSLL